MLQLEENHELTWDAGDKFPEPCLDNLPPKIVGMNEAAMLLAGGFGFFYSLISFAKYCDKASTVPFAPSQYPYDNLKTELGGYKM